MFSRPRAWATAAVMVALAYVAAVGQYRPPGGGGGAAVWGLITGTLSSQSDLNSALGGKAASNASTTVNGATCTLGSSCTASDPNKQSGLPVQAATTGALPLSPTYSNGTAGVGATLTAGSNGALTVDGYTPVLNDRLLIWQERDTTTNGIYKLSTVGTGSVPYVLTRTTDYDTPAKINSASTIAAINGTSFFSNIFVPAGTVGTIGSDSISVQPASSIANGPYVKQSGVFFGPIFQITVPPTTSWSSVNVGTSTFSQQGTGNIIINWQTSSGQNQARCYMQALPTSTNYSASIGQATRAANVGIGIANGTGLTASLILVWQDSAGTISSYNFSAGGAVLGGQYFADVTKMSVSAPLMWMQIKDAGGNRVVSIGADGENWTPINTQASHTSITETQFGMCHETNVTNPTLATNILDFRMTTP